MANNPKKAQDATEAAMAAIQEALNVRDAEMKAASSKPAPAPEPRNAAPEVRKPVASAPVPSVEPRRIAAGQTDAGTFISEIEPTVEPGRPANDDWKSVGQVLQNARTPSS